MDYAIITTTNADALKGPFYTDAGGHHWAVTKTDQGYSALEATQVVLAAPNETTLKAQIEDYAKSREKGTYYTTTNLWIAGGVGLLAGYLIAKSM